MRAYVCADATTYVWPPELPLHIVLVETMQRALEKEPQAAVSLNLAPQLCDGGILVPERISVDLCLYDPAREFPVANPDGTFEDTRLRLNLGTVPESTAKSARRLARDADYPVAVLDVPAEAAIFRPCCAPPSRCSAIIRSASMRPGITTPHQLSDVAGAHRVHVRYAGGPQPAFRCEPMDAR